MQNDQHPKVSKLAVTVFILTILMIIAVLIGGFVFDNFTYLLIGIAFDTVILVLFFLLIGWVKKEI